MVKNCFKPHFILIIHLCVLRHDFHPDRAYILYLQDSYNICNAVFIVILPVCHARQQFNKQYILGRLYCYCR